MTARQRLGTMMMSGAIVAMAGIGLSADASAQPQETSVQMPDVILTMGEGEVQVPPDRAFVSIAAEARSKISKEAQRQNAEAMAAVQAKLKGAGISGDAVRTTSIDLQPEFDYQDGKQSLRGYVARNTIEVRVDAIDRLGDILDLAVGSGATSIGGVRFDVKDRAEAERRALDLAVTEARSRAEAIARSAGRGVGAILRIEDQSDRSAPPPRPMMASFRQAAEAATPVAPGLIEIRGRVALTVRLK